MKYRLARFRGAVAASTCWIWIMVLSMGSGSAVTAALVELKPTPAGGIQPQLTVASDGTVHMVYFKGKPGGGDLFYVRGKNGADWSEPIQVNSRRGSAIATGSIRGAQLALGRAGRVHVVWNGGAGARASGHDGAPLLYTRLNDARTAFEAEQDMIHSFGLDGGGTVAADSTGRVYLAWHAPRPGTTKGEMGRAVFLRRSLDDGKTFSAEAEVSPDWGACGCCGMKAYADPQGFVAMLYRAATDSIHRDEVLLISRDSGKNFEPRRVGLWETAACPMSSAFLGSDGRMTLAAWETQGQVYFLNLARANRAALETKSPPGQGKRKHPVLATNAKGETLLVWTEGTGWEQGGEVAWQLFDANGRPLAERGARAGVPVWGLAAAFAKPDGNFVVLY